MRVNQRMRKNNELNVFIFLNHFLSTKFFHNELFPEIHLQKQSKQTQQINKMKIQITFHKATFTSQSQSSTIQGRYFICQCGDQFYQTQLYKSLSFEMNETFEFVFTPKEQPTILIEYHEKTMTKKDKYRDFIFIPFLLFQKSNSIKQSFYISNGNEIDLSLQLIH